MIAAARQREAPWHATAEAESAPQYSFVVYTPAGCRQISIY